MSIIVKVHGNNGEFVEISPSDVEKMSKINYIPTEIIKELGLTEEIPSMYEARNQLSSLHYRVSELQETMQTLETIQKKDTRDKILAVCATAFFVGIIALGIGIIASSVMLSVMTGGLAGAGIALGTLLCTFFLSNIYNDVFKDEKGMRFSVPYGYDREFGGSGDKDHLMNTFFAGPFIPCLQTFGRTARLSKLVSKQQKAIESLKKEIKAELETVMPKIFDFYHNCSPLITKIQNQIQKINESLATLETLSEKTPAGMKELERRAKQYAEALSHFDLMVKICNELYQTRQGSYELDEVLKQN